MSVVPQSSGALGVRFRGVGKDYGPNTVLADFDLDVAPGELLTILGPSGSGKTTVLNLLAGFAGVSRGTLLIGDNDVTHLPPERRNLSMVFQNFALFPHLTVRENVEFPLRMRGVSSAMRRTMALDVLARVRLESFADRWPAQLSGGQKQRVSIARALVFKPPVLLMDESLSALDLKLREQLQEEIRRLHRETGTTILFVTHDQGEAMALSDRIAVMDGGRLIQTGTPEEIHDRPATRFIAGFIGRTNIFDLATGKIAGLDSSGLHMEMGAARALSVRPGRIRPLAAGASASVTFDGVVVDRIFTGEFHDYLLAVAGRDVAMRLPAGAPLLERGTQGRFGFDSSSAVPLFS